MASGVVAAASVALRTSRGVCRPFGATPVSGGINFAVFSRHAHAVVLMLFREGQEEPFAEIALDPQEHRTGDVWHILVANVPPDTLYGYRVDGPFVPKKGHHFNSKAILFDPYARALSGGHPWAAPESQPVNGTLGRLGRIVVDDFDWGNDRAPRTPLSQTVLYELHVRGFTAHRSSSVRHPGTFLGLAEKIGHLKALGVTAVQLMPALEFNEMDQTRRHPTTKELLRNYWGYSPLSHFAPKAAYAAEAGQQVREFKQMVKAFHLAGIEVILDVVYNHTCEGDDKGLTLSYRGFDNAVYYLLDHEGRHFNFSGCGNTLNCNHPVVRDLIIESLAALVVELHVDGFRFDLATILGRGPNGEALADPPLLKHIAEHPVLAGAKLLAEPWDAAGLWQVGKFPAWGRWAEFNGLFRDDVRHFLRGDSGFTAHVVKRLCGSLDLYGESARHPYHSINFVTCHDGFTLHDLVSYNRKHNEANGEDNRDGWPDNISWNCGQEGETKDSHTNALRQRQMRNFLTMLLIAQGVPLLLQGDEFGRTQQGNNNAYCQDNDISWVDWNLARKHDGLVRFTRMMLALRKRYFAIGPDEFVNRVSWHSADHGDPDWTGQSRALAFHLHCGPARADLYVMFNAHQQARSFGLPGRGWRRLVDTNLPAPDDMVEEKSAIPVQPANSYLVSAHSAVILIS
jgi:glycogen operon protein